MSGARGANLSTSRISRMSRASRTTVYVPLGSSQTKRQFGYRCEYCEGTVRAKRLECEAFKHKSGFVIHKPVTIGICDQCGNRLRSRAHQAF